MIKYEIAKMGSARILVAIAVGLSVSACLAVTDGGQDEGGGGWSSYAKGAANEGPSETFHGVAENDIDKAVTQRLPVSR